MYTIPTVLLALLTTTGASAQVVGSPFGFASSVTGGGDATPVYPTSIDECVSHA
jgi:pectin lyase